MPKYSVVDPSSGRKLSLEGDSPPTESELNGVFGALPSGSETVHTAIAPKTPAVTLKGLNDKAGELAGIPPELKQKAVLQNYVKSKMPEMDDATISGNWDTTKRAFAENEFGHKSDTPISDEQFKELAANHEHISGDVLMDHSRRWGTSSDEEKHGMVHKFIQGIFKGDEDKGNPDDYSNAGINTSLDIGPIHLDPDKLVDNESPIKLDRMKFVDTGALIGIALKNIMPESSSKTIDSIAFAATYSSKVAEGIYNGPVRMAAEMLTPENVLIAESFGAVGAVSKLKVAPKVAMAAKAILGTGTGYFALSMGKGALDAAKQATEEGGESTERFIELWGNAAANAFMSLGAAIHSGQSALGVIKGERIAATYSGKHPAELADALRVEAHFADPAESAKMMDAAAKIDSNYPRKALKDKSLKVITPILIDKETGRVLGEGANHDVIIDELKSKAKEKEAVDGVRGFLLSDGSITSDRIHAMEVAEKAGQVKQEYQNEMELHSHMLETPERVFDKASDELKRIDNEVHSSEVRKSIIPQDGDTTSVKNSKTASILEMLNLRPHNRVEAISFPTSIENALERAKKQPDTGSSLVRRLLDEKNKGGSHYDTWDLHVELAERNIRLKEAQKRFSEANKIEDPIEREIAAKITDEAYSFHLGQVEEAIRAAKSLGTEQGRGLGARRAVLKEDFSFAHLARKYIKATGEREMSPDKQKEYDNLSQKLQEAQAQAEAADRRAEKSHKKYLNEIERKASSSKQVDRKRLIGITFKILSENEAKARDRIREHKQNFPLNIERDPSILGDIASVAASKMSDRKRRAVVVEDLISEFGEEIRPHITEIMKQADTQKLEAQKIAKLSDYADELKRQLRMDEVFDPETKKMVKPSSEQISEIKSEIAKLEADREYARDRIQPDRHEENARKEWRDSMLKKIDRLEKIKAGEEMKKKDKAKPPLPYSFEDIKIKDKFEKLKGEIEQKIRDEANAKRAPWLKTLDSVVWVGKNSILTSANLLIKLPASTILTMPIKTATEFGGIALSYLPKAKELGLMESRTLKSWYESEKESYKRTLLDTKKEAGKVIRGEKTQYEIHLGEHIPHNASGYIKNLFDWSSGKKGFEWTKDLDQKLGRLHKLGHMPAILNDFHRKVVANEMNMRELGRGDELADPAVFTAIRQGSAVEAMNAGYIEHDRFFSGATRAAISWAENQGHKTKAETLGALTAAFIDLDQVVRNVPINIASQYAEYGHGALTGGASYIKGLIKGFEGMSEKDMDLALRRMKNGQVGVILGIAGWVGYESLGGSHVAGEAYGKDEGDEDAIKTDAMRIGGVTIPSLMLHTPAMMYMQTFASAHRLMDEIYGNKNVMNYAESFMRSMFGVAHSVPGFQESLPIQLAARKSPLKTISNWVSQRAIPSAVDQLAKFLDKPENMNEAGFIEYLNQKNTNRYPSSFEDVFKQRIPILRKQVQNYRDPSFTLFSEDRSEK